MKRINFFRISLLLLLFALVVVPISCGSDDSDPIVMTDADGDGVVDKDDACPNEAGLAALDGCPEDVDSEESTVPIGPLLLKINSGGPEVTIGSETFLAESFNNGSEASYLADASITDIENTELDEIYFTERITGLENTNGPISYDIPISNGTYTIKLHFAEVYWGVLKTDGQGDGGGIGSRIFDVDIEETPVLNNLDVFEVAGGAAKAITRMYDIEVTDGELNIIFTSTTDRPKISAIEVFGNGTIN